MPTIPSLSIHSTLSSGDQFVVETSSGTLRAYYLSIVPTGNLAYLRHVQSWSGTQSSIPQNIPFASSILPNLIYGNVFNITLSGNVNFGQPTGVVDGATYIWRIYNTGTVVWNTGYYDFGTDGQPTLTNTANKYDILTFLGRSNNKLDYAGIRAGQST